VSKEGRKEVSKEVSKPDYNYSYSFRDNNYR